MATSDRGLVDVERFDLEPQRQILHGLLGELDVALLPGMSSREKVPHMLRFLEAEQLSPRMAASVVEIDRTLSTWPQLAGDVVLGATVLAEAVRRIGLGEDLRSGRTRFDVGGALRRDDIARAATILAAADRTRYLTPRLHADMVSELRWPGDPCPDTGIDVRSLELDPGDLAVLDILRRPEVMAHLAQWNAGTALARTLADEWW
jgi:hypothetical protein